MIHISDRGNFNGIKDFINRVLHKDIYADLDRWGEIGVTALSEATPRATGQAAASWSYKILTGSKPGIAWYNGDVDEDGVPIVILIQYGHATGTGGYVQGRDFINPAMMPVFDRIANDIWEGVTR